MALKKLSQNPVAVPEKKESSKERQKAKTKKKSLKR